MQKDFVEYSNDEIIDLTGTDEYGEKVSSDRADGPSEEDIKVKNEAPDEDSEITGRVFRWATIF